MIIVFATITLKSGKSQEFLEISKNLISNTRLEDGSIDYDLYASTEVDDVFLVVEKWKNEEVLNEHMETVHFKKFVDEASPIFAKDLELVQYEVKE
jgi:quinol monooxygenase YgiN